MVSSRVVSHLDRGGSSLMALRRTLSAKQRKEYIAAVQCLRTKPSTLDPVTTPGAKSLFDDFVAIHLMQTMNIHLSVCLHHRISAG